MKRSRANQELSVESSGRKSIQVLLLYTASIIAICLTAFNLYLLCWLWSSLRPSSSSLKMAQMDLLSSWETIKFNGRLASRDRLEAAELRQLSAREELSISSQGKVQLAATVGLNQGDRRKTRACASDIMSTTMLAEVSARESKIQFPAGLIVRGLQQREDQLALVCQLTGECQVRTARVRLGTRSRGIEADRKSVQTTKVRTKLIHSPTNSLHILSPNSSLFESKNGSISLLALEEISLFSRNSAVILEAKTINVEALSRSLGGFNSLKPAPTTKARLQQKQLNTYKLCVCLRAKQRSIGSITSSPSSETTRRQRPTGSGDKLGLVFAIREKLECARFGPTICNKLAHKPKEEQHR